MPPSVVKSIAIDIGIKNVEASKAKLDEITARAEALKEAFPEYKVKIETAAAAERLAVFKGQVKAVADDVKKPADMVVLTDRARRKLLEVSAEAEKLRATFPEFTVRINDAEAKRKLALFAAEARVTTDEIDRRLGGAGGAGRGGILGSLAARLFSGGGGGGGAGQAAGGLGGAGPWAIGGLAGLAAVLAPGLVGLGIGGGVGALGIGGSIAAASYLQKQVTAAQAALKRAQAKGAPSGALPAAQANLAEARQMAAPFAGLTGALGNLGETALMTFARAVGPLLKPLPGIFAQMGAQIKGLGPLMTQMFSASLPFVRVFAGLLTQAGKILMPALTQAMQQMVKSGALTLMTQGLTEIIKGIAGFITALGPGMKSSAMLFRDTSVIIEHALRFAGLAVSWFANVIEDYFHKARLNMHQWASVFDDFRHRTAVIFDGVRHDIAHIWDMIWQNTIGRLMRGVADSQKVTANFEHAVAAAFDRLRHDVAAIWDAMWNNTVGRVRRGVADVTGWFAALPGRVTGALSHLGTDLFNLGKAALGQLWDGIKNVAGGIGGGLIGWLGNFAHSIVNVFKKIWGWFSPSTVMYEGGKALMQGLANGIKDHAHQAVTQAAGAANKVANVGSGVARWRGLVVRALAMEGLSPQLVDAVLYQMQTESGGNPNAINLTDINAQRGDPSRGLMQTIMSTFRAYHWPGTSWNIYDPLANIAAALNYARHNYGPGLRNAYGGIGTGRGYALGTGWAMPGWAWVGEHGPELLKFRGGEQVHPAMIPAARSGPAVINHYYIDVSVPVSANKRETGREVVQAIKAFEQGAGAGWRSGVDVATGAKIRGVV